MLRLRNYFIFLFLISFYFLLSAASVSAQTPRRYYDWSSTLDQGKQQVLGIQAFAQENAGSTTTSKDLQEFNRYFIGGNLTPSSPFYFIKPFQENMQMTFTFDPKTKENMRLGITGERVAEMQELIKQNQINALSAAASGYEHAMTDLAGNAESLQKQKINISDILKKIEEETAKHNVVLEEVAVQVPDTQKQSIEKALEANWQGVDTVADLSNRPAVPPDVVDRIQALKAQGLLTEEESSKLISAKNRTEARQELRKYVTEGVLPEADFMRMNENVKQLYPDDFYKIHEVKRFYEMKRLETEKPDDATLTKVQEFAKTYKQGDIVPADIRRYWVPVVRLEEIQNTLRPDLIDSNIFKNRQDDYKKFTEVVERFKPKPEDLAYINNYIQNNNADVNSLPPEYQRMYKLSQQYGAACGAGQRWIPQSQSGGYCAPEGSSNLGDLPKTEDFAKGKSCSRAVTAAKGPGGVCSAYPTDCVPPGWTSASTCVETPRSETTGGQFGQAVTKGATSCPSNAHFVAVPFDPNGGYCIPNYTSTQTAITGNNATGATFTESSCSSGYHRNYPGGPCLQDYGSNRTGIASLPPLTSTPGNYPSPTYPTRQCGPGSRFVSDPFGGGYCAPDNYPGPGSSGGTGGTASCTQPAGGCPSGWSWNQSACSCLSTSGKAADSATCKPPSGGCPGGWNWNQNNCSCVSNSYQPSSSGTSIPYSGSTSPSGYGSCPSGMSWNGSYCTGTYTGGTSGGSSGGTYTGSGTSGGTYSGSGTQTSGGNYQPPSGGSSGTYQAPQPYYSQPPTQTTTTTSPPPSETSSSSPPPSSEPSSSSPPPTESTSSSPPPSTTTTSGCGGGSGIPC